MRGSRIDDSIEFDIRFSRFYRVKKSSEMKVTKKIYRKRTNITTFDIFVIFVQIQKF